MAETILKSKLQLRSTSVISNGSSNGGGGDKTPTTPSKLMINHGKPNFTIQRSPKAQQNGEGDPLENNIKNNNNNNYNAFKSAGIQNYSNNNVVVSTKFNGAFKPTNVPITQKQPHQTDGSDNEAAKVVLRRAKVPEPSSSSSTREDEDESVPEFIRRQRRIQERLAKENILDFESRRSGYFTHVMISPTSPNRQSFGATMSSPPVVPALETPAPTPALTLAVEEEIKERSVDTVLTNGSSAEHDTTVEEEEVAKAIEEVNKAVEGEDDEIKDEQNTDAAVVVAVATTWEIIPEPTAEDIQNTPHKVDFDALANQEQNTHVEVENSQNEQTEEAAVTAVASVASLDIEETNVENDVESNVDAHPPAEQNGHIEVVEVHDAPQEKGHNDITISHTNGFDGPKIPAPDPSGALGVNYEPKTVVSFSKDLGGEPNKYPDTVKVVSQNGGAPIDEELQELAKLKFDIKADEQDVQVTPVLRAD